MSTFLIVGTAGEDFEFGTDGVGYTGIGTIVSGGRDDTGDKLELRDRKGAVFVVIYFNDKNECTIDVIFDSTVTIPERGDALSLCGLTSVLCDRVQHKWENQRERMLTITGTKYSGLTLA